MCISGKGHLGEFRHKIRKFTMEQCVKPSLEQRKEAMEKINENNNGKEVEAEQITDLLDEFLNNVGKVEDMTLENALFSLEDIFGGHSAVSNFLSTVTVFLARNPEVQEKIREEVRAVA